MAMRSVVGGRIPVSCSVRIFKKAAILTLSTVGSLSTISAATVSWNFNPEPDIAGYKVFWGETNTAPAIIDVGKTNRYSANSLAAGRTYFFQVCAYNSANLESPRSAPVYFTNIVNTAPSISTLPDQTIAMDAVSGPLSFTVGDAETAAASLVLTVASSNTGLVPLSRIAFGGSGASRTITLTPMQGASGTSRITINVLDGTLVASSSFTLTVNAPPPPDYLGLWLGMGFEESGPNALDLSPNQNHGAITGSVIRAVAGEYGGVLEFNGNGGRVDLGGLDIPGGALTIACWMRADTFNISDARLISKATGPNEADHVWMLSTVASNGIKPRLRLKTTGGATTTLIGTVNLIAGTWTHLAATYDGSTVRLYVNGQAAGSAAKTGGIAQASTVPAVIGDQPEGGRSFDGLIDDLRLYTRALNPSEIQQAMSELLGVPQQAGDTTPPSAPQNLVASVLSTSVQLNWNAATDGTAVGFYKIFRDGAEIATATDLEYVDSGLTPDTTYRYEVRAVDTAGNVSAPSNALVTKTLSNSLPEPGLWLGMAFEETGAIALDRSPNENHGILTGPVVRSLAEGFGGVLDFNGNGSRVDLGGLDIPGNAFTIACWIRPDTFLDDARIISKATGVNESDHVWMLSTTASGGVKPRMRLKTSSSATKTLIGTIDIPSAVWTHLAATYDGATMRLYVNGQPAGSLAKTGTVAQAPNIPAAIGDQPQGGRSFNGLMDDLRIYTRAFNETEIQALIE
jgi:hypothetical protein